MLYHPVNTLKFDREILRGVLDTGEATIGYWASGVILLELRFFEEALSLFKQSQDALGCTATTSYNLGLCSLGLGRTSEAIAFMLEACDLNPAFEPARLMRGKLRG
jgi:hypothetical protein